MGYKSAKIVAAVPAKTRAGITFTSLLSDPVSNPKLAKGLKLGVYSAPLHLAPANLSGRNVCAKASPGCIAACLHTAGRTFTMESKSRARIARTRLFFEDRATFMMLLVGEIAAHLARANALNMVPAIRLNATSDIPWERIPVTMGGVVFPSVMALFPAVTFYDYTKVTKRALAFARGSANWPANYHLTFSLSEQNDSDAAAVLAAGGNVAAVFAVRRSGALPRAFAIAGRVAPVVDADTHDFRPDDGRGVIAGLRAKGKAIGDVSGFVRAPVAESLAA